MEKKLKKNLVKGKSYLLESKDAESKGITLVALVITIVVLLILAGVSIGTLFGNNGIITKAQEAVDRTQEGVEEEKKEFENLLEQLNNIGNWTGGNTGNNTEGGNTEGGGDTPEEPEVPAGWDTDQVTPVESADGKMVPVPKGFTASEVSRKVTINGEEVDDIENTVAGGFVIYQGTEKVDNSNLDTAKTTRNQFVWVPVQNIEDIYDSVNNAGQLYDFGTSSSPKNPPEKIAYPITQVSVNVAFREPDVVTLADYGAETTSGSSYDADETYLSIVGISSTGKAGAEAFKTQLENEFKDMKDSVEKYGGFYIGRYETGGLDTAVTSPARVVKGQGDGQINKKNWYIQYQKSKLIASGTSATSSMIWDCQWDATLNWFLSQGGDNAIYVTNGYVNGIYNGNYYGTKENRVIATGSKDAYKVNNIYDMAGNVEDWSIGSGGRSLRATHGRQLRKLVCEFVFGI